MATQFQATRRVQAPWTDGNHQGSRRIANQTRAGSLGTAAGRRRCTSRRHADRLGVMAAVLRRNLALAPYLSLLISGSDLAAAHPRPSDEESREAFWPLNRRRAGRCVSDYLAKQMARILKVLFGFGRITKSRYPTWDLTR